MAINQEYKEYRVNTLPVSNLNPGDRYYLNLGANKYKTYIVNDLNQLVSDSIDEFLNIDTVSELRALTDRQIWSLQNNFYKGVKLHGYYAKGDTPIPIDYYLYTGTDIDDGSSVFSIDSIKLKHDFKGQINASYFGLNLNNIGDTINKCITYLKTNGGGKIDIPFNVNYLLNDQINVPFDNEYIEINFNNSLITFTDTEYQLFVMYDIIQNLTFGNFRILNLNVDAAKKGNTTYSTTALIGSRLKTGERALNYNINQLHFENITVKNVASIKDQNIQRCVTVTPYHNGPNEALQNRVDNISFKNVHLEGGRGGFQINAFHLSGQAAGESVNVYFDNIIIDNCSHYLPEHPDFYACSNVHIGGWGYGNYCSITNFKGNNSGDNCIEINAMMLSIVDNVQSSRQHFYDLYYRNFRMPDDISKQTHTASNLFFETFKPSCRNFGFGSEGAVNIPLGTINLNNMHVSLYTPFLSAQCIQLVALSGGTKEINNFTLDGLYVKTMIATTKPTANFTGSIIHIGLLKNESVKINNVFVDILHNITATGNIFPRIIHYGAGDYKSTINNIRIQINNNLTECWGLYVDAPLTQNQKVSNYDVKTFGSTIFRGVRLNGVVLSETTKLQLEYVDFSKITTGSNYSGTNTTNLNLIDKLKVIGTNSVEESNISLIGTYLQPLKFSNGFLWINSTGDAYFNTIQPTSQTDGLIFTGKTPLYTTANRPTLPNGALLTIYDSNLNKPLWGRGTTSATIWRDATGTTV